MDYKFLNLHKGISRYPLVLITALVLMTMVSLPQAMAQKSRSFTANGKQVNIARFNKEVSKMMDEMGVPGLSLAIIENDEIVFVKGYGKKRVGEPKDAWHVGGFGVSVKDLKIEGDIDGATVFNGASLSKTFLAFVAYQMVDEGLLDLDKPMIEYMNYDRIEPDERYKLITARMILSHSSGLENWESNNDSDKLEIMGNPGEEFIYSGEGYNYLALVTKQLLEESYSVYVKERVIDRLGLKNSYLSYNVVEESPIPPEKSIPSNFAIAHPLSGGQYLLRNTRVNPAYANHFSAEDYAKLVLGMFDTANLSAERRKDILEPRVRMGESSVFYGPAFELIINEGDTIISHGGDNAGYKNLMYYSPVKKRGFVMLANNDWAKSMASRLNELSVGLDIDKFFDPKYDYTFSIQYPNPALNLLKEYAEKDSTGLFTALAKYKKKGKIDAKAMNGLAMFFKYYGDDDIEFKLLEETKALFPETALTYCLLGDHYLDNEQYQLALDHYNKALALNFSYWKLDRDIAYCKKELSKPD